MKKKLLTGLLLLVVALVTVQGTMAYLQASSVAHNVITTGEIDIELVETRINDKGEEETYPTDPVDGIMPDEEVSKRVHVKNTGPNTAWVRIVLGIEVDKEDGTPYDPSLISLNLNKTDWLTKEGEEGVYYYKYKLEPGQQTKPLFTTVTFHKDMGNDYQNCEIRITVQAQGTQAANNDPADGVLSVKGWPN